MKLKMKFLAGKKHIVKAMAKKRLSRGFTLIELMVVVLLLALLMTFGGIAFFNRLESGKISTAKSQSLEFSKAIELFRLDNNRYPTIAEGLQGLANPPSGLPYIEEVPKDPWGNEYIYIYPGQRNTSKFDIVSRGPDGIESDDDIGNWEEEAIQE